jgi:hypothetical protein
MSKTSRKKMSKRDRRALDASARRVWQISPITRRKPNKKLYDRKKCRMDDDRIVSGTFLYMPRAAAF